MDNQLVKLGLTERDGKAVVSSRNIARVFEKEHRRVLQDVRTIAENDLVWGLHNFVQSTYTNEQNKSQPEYLITRDGFTLLVMGYTGEKAMRFKKAYIAAFNEMERRFAPRNYKEALLALVAAEEKKEALAVQNKVLQLTADKYEGQTDTVGLYKAGEIAKELGISAKRLNDFLHNCRVQYRPNGSNTWQLYTDYAKDHIAATQLVRLNNGCDMPMLLWTPKGRDFIFDLAEREMPAWYA